MLYMPVSVSHTRAFISDNTHSVLITNTATELPRRSSLWLTGSPAKSVRTSMFLPPGNFSFSFFFLLFFGPFSYFYFFLLIFSFFLFVCFLFCCCCLVFWLFILFVMFCFLKQIPASLRHELSLLLFCFCVLFCLYFILFFASFFQPRFLSPLRPPPVCAKWTHCFGVKAKKEK